MDSIELMINLTGALFNDDTLFDKLVQNMEQQPIAKDKLYFCFPETSIFNNLESARIKLDILSQLGVRTIIANITGGFSSIARIRGLPIDYLQVDQAIVRAPVLNPVNQIFIRTISEVAKVSWYADHSCY